MALLLGGIIKSGEVACINALVQCWERPVIRMCQNLEEGLGERV